ncbi:MAG: TolC family protein [Pseudomonadota bacterium]
MRLRIAERKTLWLLALVSASPLMASAADIFGDDVLLADRYRDITPLPASAFAELSASRVAATDSVVQTVSEVQQADPSEAAPAAAQSVAAVMPAESGIEASTESATDVADIEGAAKSDEAETEAIAEIADTSTQIATDTDSESPGFFGRLRNSVRGYLLQGTPEYEAEQRAAARQRAAAARESGQDPVEARSESKPPAVPRTQAVEPMPVVAEAPVVIEKQDTPPVIADDKPATPEPESVVAEAAEPASPAVPRTEADGEEKRPLVFRLTNIFSGREYKPVLEQLAEYQDIATEELGERAEMFVTASPDDKGISLMGSQLNLRDFLHLVAIYNDRVAYQKLEWAIAKSGVDSARALYEPELMASYRYTDSNTPNTTEEEFRRSFAAEFIEQNDDYSVGVEGLVPTGARLKLTYNLRSLENNIQPAPIRGEENKSYVGFSVTQPVLKGAGGRKVVEAPIIVARKEEGIAMQTFRQALLQSISGAATAYLDAYLAEKKTDLRKRSVEIAESVVKDERERQRFGRSAETTVLDAESALAQRRVQFLTAQQELLAARNEMHRLIASRAGESSLPMVLETSLETSVAGLDRVAVLEDAFRHRPEYLASILRAEAEDVKVRYARNNKLPQLDLVASYGLNGLADTTGNSWDDVWDRQHETLFVGLEFKMPLLGNRKAKGELSAANLRKHQALLEIKAAEVAIYNSVDTALSNIRSALEQVGELSMVRETNERLLAVEIARFEAGQSNSRDLLELEERMNRVMEMDLESKINLQKASIGLGLSDGTLLKRFQLEK